MDVEAKNFLSIQLIKTAKSKLLSMKTALFTKNVLDTGKWPVTIFKKRHYDNRRFFYLAFC
jgi:hypothetical protein